MHSCTHLHLIDPEVGELAITEGHHLVARAEGVLQRGFPAACACAWVDDRGSLLGAEDILRVLEDLCKEWCKPGVSVVGPWPIHLTQHAVMNVHRPYMQDSFSVIPTRLRALASDKRSDLPGTNKWLRPGGVNE